MEPAETVTAGSPGGSPDPGHGGGRVWTPWRTVAAFGFVSLTADMVYEGMRSVAGPFLAALGASALLVGLVTGAGEAIALVLRLVTGPAADRTGRYWRLTWWGYALTAVSVPLLAVTPFLGAAGLVTASALILAERTGKAVRSPSKSALLARMAVPVGRGRGFAVHKALDQVGAFCGPLLIAGVAALTGRLWPGFAILAIPGAASMVLLHQLHRRAPIDLDEARPPAPVPDGPASLPDGPAPATRLAARGPGLPGRFYAFAGACSAATLGLMTFGVISYHLVAADLVSAPVVPVVYAGAMAIEAVAALATGFTYDRVSGRVLLVLPLLVALVPAAAFAEALPTVLFGVAVWGLATGILDSTVKALVSDIVPGRQLATAYGWFALFQGCAALAGGALAGALYADHLPLLIGLVATLQVLSFGLLILTLRAART